MFVCPEFGQQVLPGETKHSETRGAGINQQYTRSDEQQDGMRPDGLDRVSCCYYSLPRVVQVAASRRTLLPLVTVAAVAACCLLLLLLLPPTPPVLVRHQRRLTSAQPQPPRNPTTLPSLLAQQPSGPSSPAGTSSYVLVALGWHVTRHPSPSTILWHVAEGGGHGSLVAAECCHLPSRKN